MPTTKELLNYLRQDSHNPNRPDYLGNYDAESDVEVLCKDINDILQSKNKIINSMEYSFEENPRNIEQLKDELRTLKQGIDTLLFTKLKLTWIRCKHVRGCSINSNHLPVNMEAERV